MKAALKKAGIVSKAKTHAGRGSSVRVAELEGCAEGEHTSDGRMLSFGIAENIDALLAGFDANNRTFIFIEIWCNQTRS